MANWTSADLSRAAALAVEGKQEPAAVAFARERNGTKKTPFEAWVFDLLIFLAEGRR